MDVHYTVSLLTDIHENVLQVVMALNVANILGSMNTKEFERSTCKKVLLCKIGWKKVSCDVQTTLCEL
jgi:cytochrome b